MKSAPMSAFAERIFLGEVWMQCKFVLRAVDDLGAALQLPVNTPDDIEPRIDGIWYAVQNLLVSAATISRLLWGDYEDEAKQRQPLRKRLGVNAKSPLYKRSLRNHFEHVDARIMDQFGAPGAGGPFVGRNIGPHSAIKGIHAPRFHNFDPATGLVTFWKDSVSIPAVVKEVDRIMPIAFNEFIDS